MLTTEQKQLLVERKEYTDFLDKNKHACLLSPKGAGKTLILKQYKDAVYIDLSRLSISPENFAVEYIGTILHAASNVKPELLRSYLDINFLLEQKLQQKPKDILESVYNELLKIKPDQLLLLKLAFSFPDSLNKDLTIAIDEFQEMLALNNYLQISNILDIFMENKGTTDYKLASSSIHSLNRLNLPKKIVEDFNLRETKEFCTLLAKRLSLKLSEKDKEEIYKYSRGSPIAIEAIARRFKDNVKDAFITEIVYEKSQTYSHLSSVFSSSLNSARGATLLKTLLKVMSQNKGLRLTEIAKKIYRSSPVTKALLERLMEVDLVVKDGTVFRFSSSLLKTWCRMMFANIGLSQLPSKDELTTVKKLFDSQEVDDEA